MMRSIQQSLSELFLEQGIVRTELYDEALDAFTQLKPQLMDEFAQNEE